MASDIIARGLAAKATGGLKTLEEKIDLFSLGINWKGAVNYESDLPTSPAHGDGYTVKYTGTSGTDPNGQIYVWDNLKTHTWIKFGQDVAALFKEVKLKQDQLVAGYGIKLTPNTTTRKTTIELSIATFDIKGAKEYYANLPGSGNTEGDLWYVKKDDTDLAHTKGWYCWVTDSGVSTWLKIDSDTEWGKIQGDIENQTDLKEALNKRVEKQTTTDEHVHVYGYNKEGETTVDLTSELNNKLSKVSVVSEDDQLYGKTKEGAQTMVNVESLIKVKDFKFNGTSVIDGTTKIGSITVKKSPVAAAVPEDLTYLQIEDKIYTIKGEATAAVASLNTLTGGIVMSVVEGTGTDAGKKFIKLTNGDITKDKLIEFIQVTEVIDESNKLPTSKAVKDYVDDKDVRYITLTGTSGTLTTEQRATLLAGQPINNFIDKDHMLFKCVWYNAGNTKAIYSIAGEGKIHVITVLLPSGAWTLTSYPYPIIDSELSETSVNALQNKIITAELNKKVDKTVTFADGTVSSVVNGEDNGGSTLYMLRDSNASEVGITTNSEGDIGAQIYFKDTTSNSGSRLDVTKEGIYYTVGADGWGTRKQDKNKLATAGDVDKKLDKKVAESTDDKTYAYAFTKDGQTAVDVTQLGKIEDVLENGTTIVDPADKKAKIVYDSVIDSTTSESTHAPKTKAVKVELDKKVDKELNSTSGKSLVFNEADGGGVKFEHVDGTNSFVGVNDGGATGIAGQIYVVNKDDATEGCKINLEKDKFTYIKNKATSARTAEDEIAVIGDVNKKLDRATADSFTTDTTKLYAVKKDGSTIEQKLLDLGDVGKVQDVKVDNVSVLDENSIAQINYDTIINDSTKESTKAPQTKAVKTYVDAEVSPIRNLLKGDASHTGGNAVRIPYYFDVAPQTDKIKVTAKGVYLNETNQVVWEPTENSININSATETLAGLLGAEDKKKLNGFEVATENEIRTIDFFN